MDEQAIQQLYSWIDEIVLSRPKRNITRDFSDGVLAAEIVAHFLPSYVELHNYTPANNSQQKRTNWETLNRKVFKRFDFNVPSNIVTGIILCKPGVIEIVLYNLRVKILNYKKKEDEESESDAKSEPGQWNGAPPNGYYPNMPDPNMGQYPHQMPGYAPYPPQSEVFRHQPPASHPNSHAPHPHNNKQESVTPPTHPCIATNIATKGPLNVQWSDGRFPVISQTHSNLTVVASNFLKADADKDEALSTIPYDGEQQRKKKSPKKKKIPASNPAKIAESERSRSMPLSLAHLDNESRIFIQEREQALLQSQETVQILQSKIGRLEHLLQLKDLRIEDLDSKLKASHQKGGRAKK